MSSPLVRRPLQACVAMSILNAAADTSAASQLVQIKPVAPPVIQLTELIKLLDRLHVQTGNTGQTEYPDWVPLELSQKLDQFVKRDIYDLSSAAALPSFSPMKVAAPTATGAAPSTSSRGSAEHRAYLDQLMHTVRQQLERSKIEVLALQTRVGGGPEPTAVAAAAATSDGATPRTGSSRPPTAGLRRKTSGANGLAGSASAIANSAAASNAPAAAPSGAPIVKGKISLSTQTAIDLWKANIKRLSEMESKMNDWVAAVEVERLQAIQARHESELRVVKYNLLVDKLSQMTRVHAQQLVHERERVARVTREAEEKRYRSDWDAREAAFRKEKEELMLAVEKQRNETARTKIETKFEIESRAKEISEAERDRQYREAESKRLESYYLEQRRNWLAEQHHLTTRHEQTVALWESERAEWRARAVAEHKLKLELKSALSQVVNAQTETSYHASNVERLTKENERLQKINSELWERLRGFEARLASERGQKNAIYQRAGAERLALVERLDAERATIHMLTGGLSVASGLAPAIAQAAAEANDCIWASGPTAAGVSRSRRKPSQVASNGGTVTSAYRQPLTSATGPAAAAPVYVKPYANDASATIPPAPVSPSHSLSLSATFPSSALKAAASYGH